jgi:hypothetical protein
LYLIVTQDRTHRYHTLQALRLNGVSLGRELGLLALMFSLPVQFALASTGGGARRADGPELVIDITRRDFGEVFTGEELEQTFLLRNAGTKPLELSQKSALSSQAGGRLFPITAGALVQPGDRGYPRERGHSGRISTTGVMRPGPPGPQGFALTVAAARAAPS